MSAEAEESRLLEVVTRKELVVIVAFFLCLSILTLVAGIEFDILTIGLLIFYANRILCNSYCGKHAENYVKTKVKYIPETSCILK
jgi:hypothetical protein